MIIAVVAVLLFGMTWGSVLPGETASPFIYHAPRPNAEMVNAGTTIAVRNGADIKATSLSPTLFVVQGSGSGLHGGNLLLASDGKTVIFEPDRPFQPGERVSVKIERGIETASGAILDGTSYQFTISSKLLTIRAGQHEEELWLSSYLKESHSASATPEAFQQDAYVTAPTNLPRVNIGTPADGVDDGYVFLSNYIPGWAGGTEPFLLILDNEGEPVFYRALTPGTILLDFKKQPNGLLTYFDHAIRQFVALDNTYSIVGTFPAGNGYDADHHDLQLLDNGNYLLLAWDPQPIDMSQIVAGGMPTAIVVGLIVQELDAEGNVLFEWRSWDHFELTESSMDLTTNLVRYVHGNAVEQDLDGNVLISCRTMNEITKLDRQTGNVIWRFGGTKNEFNYLSEDVSFWRQHDIRRLSNGNITLLDNREGLTPRYSRAVEYELDEVGKTARLIWQYRNTPDTYGPFLANAQRLPNGNTLIGWGSTRPTLTEVKPDGTKAFELSFATPQVSYRSFRFPWIGRPTWPPTATVRQTESGERLYFSWNGATEVEKYRIYAGTFESGTANLLVDVVDRTGFEESIDLSPEYCYWKVEPVMRGGVTAQSSAFVSTCSIYLPLVGNN
jgi:hypothetical protein